MALTRDTDVHKRRRSRNLGLGLVLLVMAALVFGLSIVKVSVLDPSRIESKQGASQ